MFGITRREGCAEVCAKPGASVEDTAQKVIHHMLEHVKTEAAAAPSASFESKLSFDSEFNDPSSRGASSERTSSERTSSDGPLSDSGCDNEAFQRAYLQHSRASHMGVMDPGYRVFTSARGFGSLLYTVRNRTLVMSGDPLCAPAHLVPLLRELRQFRRARGWSLACIGVGEAFAAHARSKGWLALQFGRERVVDPTASPLLRRGGRRRMAAQNRQLLNPARGGLRLDVYAPGVHGADAARDAELQALYDGWRAARNGRRAGGVQTYVTVFDLRARGHLALFVCARDAAGRVAGFAALRRLGAARGFHLDPCIAAPDAPRGVSDLLVVSAMRLLATAGVGFLSLGYEPFLDLEPPPAGAGPAARLACATYRRVVGAAHLCGKKQYNDKFHPEDDLSSPLYIVLPGGPPLPQQSVAVMHVANISIRNLMAEGARQACHQLGALQLDLLHRGYQAQAV